MVVVVMMMRDTCGKFVCLLLWNTEENGCRGDDVCKEMAMICEYSFALNAV